MIFPEAVARGIFDKETGTYIHNVTGEEIFIGDAIQKGFVKAKVVDDPSTLDIDPANRVVIDRVENLKRKMKVLSAFKKASAPKAAPAAAATVKAAAATAAAAPAKSNPNANANAKQNGKKEEKK